MRSTITVLALVVAVTFGILFYQQKIRAEDAERDAGIENARVISAVLDAKQELRVATLKGVVVARAKDDGYIFDTVQESRAPFLVSYFIDLGKARIGPSKSFKTDGSIDVILPDVRNEEPAIFMNRAVVKQKGVWISRDVGIDLQKKSVVLLDAAANKKASSMEYVDRTRTMARNAVQGVLNQAFKAAGLNGATINITFAGEAARNDEQWDRSRPLSEIFADGG